MPRVSNVSQSQIHGWLRFYRTAPEGYKPKALQACLANDGPKVLAAVLRELGLEQSLSLVQDWQAEQRPEKGNSKPKEEVSGED